MSVNPVSQERPAGALGKLWAVGALAIVASVVANLLAWVLLNAVIGFRADFPPLQAGSIALFTAIGVGLAVLVFAVVRRIARQPIRTFNILAVAALLVSLIPNLALMANPAAAPMPGGTAFDYGLLIIFHIVPAAVCVPLLTRLARS